MFDLHSLEFPDAPDPLPEQVKYRFVLLYDLERGEDVLPDNAILYFEPRWTKKTSIPMGMSVLDTPVLGVRGNLVTVSGDLQNTEVDQWLKNHIKKQRRKSSGQTSP